MNCKAGDLAEILPHAFHTAMIHGVSVNCYCPSGKICRVVSQIPEAPQPAWLMEEPLPPCPIENEAPLVTVYDDCLRPITPPMNATAIEHTKELDHAPCA